MSDKTKQIQCDVDDCKHWNNKDCTSDIVSVSDRYFIASNKTAPVCRSYGNSAEEALNKVFIGKARFTCYDNCAYCDSVKCFCRKCSHFKAEYRAREGLCEIQDKVVPAYHTCNVVVGNEGV